MRSTCGATLVLQHAQSCRLHPQPAQAQATSHSAPDSPRSTVLTVRACSQAVLELLEDDDFQRDADGGTFERIVDEVKASPAAAAKYAPSHLLMCPQ